MQESRLRWIAGLACVMGLFSLVCSPPDGPAGQRGELGNLNLLYWDDDEPSSLSRPLLAVDAMADATVETLPDDEGQERGAVDEIVDVSVSDSAMLSAEIEDSDFLTLSAKEMGAPLLEIEVVTESGETLRDEFVLDTRRAVKLDLFDRCQHTPNQEGTSPGPGTYHTTYLTGAQIPMDYHLLDENGPILFGYGYFPFEITGEVDLIVDEESRDPHHFHFQAGDEPGNAQIASTIDDTKVSADLVEAGAIDGATISNQVYLGEVAAGETWSGDFLPQTDGDVICYADVDRSVTSLTPDVCEVELADSDSDNGADDAQPASQPPTYDTLTRHTVGECQIEVDYPVGNDGLGATTIISIADDGSLTFENL